jgi:hypothetical protein
VCDKHDSPVFMRVLQMIFLLVHGILRS